METLSELMQTHHSNPRVSLEKIKKSQNRLKLHLASNMRGLPIHIPNSTILESLKELNRRLIKANNDIFELEQRRLPFLD